MSTLLTLNQVSFGWGADSLLLDIPAFSLKQGEHCFVMGPSGCGKSTLLSLLAGVIAPLTGEVWLNGKDIAAQKPSARDKIRADNIGFIFQQFNLVSYLSSLENVLLPTRFSRQRAEKARLYSGHPEDEASRLLEGFFSSSKPDFARPVSQLSVGQQQRVAAARALIGSPGLIIADEPTSALDHDNRLRFMSLLMSHADSQESTLLFVSHDPTLADQFDRVLNMSDINQLPST